jgi:gluconate 2-dehydrogenase gamma chain
LPNPAISRRAFLKSASKSAPATLLVLSVPSLIMAAQQAQAAMNAARPFETLKQEEAADLEAIAARIMPSDDTPGAREAGVIYFMDKVLGNEREEVLPALRKGLSDLQGITSTRYGHPALHTLPDGMLDSLLRDIEGTPFFDTVRYLTIAGMFTAPIHGGNRDQIGWELIGFNDQHAWAPPFGYYDAEYMELGE